MVKVLAALATVPVVFAASVVSAAAAVLTFEQATPDPFAPYVESGFSVSDGGWFIPVDQGAMHFDITGGPYSAFRDITAISGARFAVRSLDILSIGPTIFTGGLTGAPRPDIAFTGYLGGQAVAWDWGSSQVGDNAFTFGSAFGNIDRLSITGFWAGNIDPQIIDVHFRIDNVDIASVPLPAAGGLGLMALGGLGLLRLRRRG